MRIAQCDLFRRQSLSYISRPTRYYLLGELHREGERVGLLRLGKHRLALVSRQPRQCLERSNSL